MNAQEEFERLSNREKKTLNNYYDQEGYRDLHLANLSLINRKWGYLMFSYEGDIKSLKQRSYNVGLLEFQLVTSYGRSHSQFFNFDIPRSLFVLLSDHARLINLYAKLRYQAHGQMPSMDEMVLKGAGAIWCNTVQFFMENNIEGVERNLNIMETITLRKLKKQEVLLKLDYEFYKALLDKDKSKCEGILEQLVSPEIHKKRNDDPVLNQYISQPAFGYAKLAWRQGVKVEVDSSLVPAELLPVQPLDHYKIPYDFLRDIS